jgi:tetratricopeptide (TPR) repeat protein
VVHFDLGNALHKTDSFDDAAKEYQRALGSKNPLVRSKAFYNLGNNAFRQEKTDEALEYYKKALDLNPSDADAKYNIEYILTQKAQQKDSKQNKDGKGKNNDKQKEQNGKDGKDSQKKDQQKGTAGQEQKQGMSKEDARRILQYYNDAEKNAAQKRKMRMPQLPKVEEDW